MRKRKQLQPVCVTNEFVSADVAEKTREFLRERGVWFETHQGKDGEEMIRVEDRLQLAASAYVTWGGSLGAKKRERNWRKYRQLVETIQGLHATAKKAGATEEELRRFVVPTDERTLSAIGKFNGAGSV